MLQCLYVAPKGEPKVMDIKKGLRMIRLCNLLYEKSIQFAAQQTRVLLHPGNSLYENPVEILQGMLCQKAPSPM